MGFSGGLLGGWVGGWGDGVVEVWRLSDGCECDSKNAVGLWFGTLCALKSVFAVRLGVWCNENGWCQYVLSQNRVAGEALIRTVIDLLLR